jgi:ribonuclease P/MRP protein subunit POP5
MDAVWGAVLQLFGEYGASQTNLILMKHNLEPNYAILRCSHKAVDIVKASITTATRINDKPVALRVSGVSGTIKGLHRQRLEAQI